MSTPRMPSGPLWPPPDTAGDTQGQGYSRGYKCSSKTLYRIGASLDEALARSGLLHQHLSCVVHGGRGLPHELCSETLVAKGFSYCGKDLLYSGAHRGQGEVGVPGSPFCTLTLRSKVPDVQCWALSVPSRIVSDLKRLRAGLP